MADMARPVLALLVLLALVVAFGGWGLVQSPVMLLLLLLLLISC